MFELTECFFEENVTLEDVDIGYVGRSNNKCVIKTNKDVEEAYSSRFSHKNDELVLYIEEKRKRRQAHKKKLSTPS